MKKPGIALALIVVGLCAFNPVFAQALLHVNAVHVDDNSIHINTSQAFAPTDAASGFNVTKLANPNRVIVDVPNADISGDAVIPVNQDGVERVEVSATGTGDNAGARITVVVDAARAAAQVDAQPSANGLKLSFSPSDVLSWVKGAPTPDESGIPGPPGRVVVKGLDFSNGQLLLNTAQRIAIKNQFLLKAPNRLVIDLDNAVLASRNLAGMRSFSDPNIQQVRLGQFDDTTVRVTITADQPQKLVVNQPEPKLLSIETNTRAVAMAAEPLTPGYLQNIYLDSPGGGGGNTQIRVHTSVPMKQALMRNGSVLSVALDNIAAVPGVIRYNNAEFPQVQKMWIEKMGAGSRLMVQLADSDARMTTALFSGKKILEVNLNKPVVAHGWVPTPVSRLPGGAMRVVIDAGHGGKDTGANRAGIYEKDLNLSVAHKLRQALEARGVKVNMTRTNDIFLPLPEITNINNSISPDVFVSVHTNSSTNPDITGIETYFFTPQSIPLANRVHRQLTSRIDSPDRGVRQARFYVIHHTQVPAILCEMGYISNASERYSLTTDNRQNATAEAIADGVVEYLKTRLTAQADAPVTLVDPQAPAAMEPGIPTVPVAPAAPVAQVAPAAPLP
jgi:N-acetylmuramoyl-L-alanine amidase